MTTSGSRSRPTSSPRDGSRQAGHGRRHGHGHEAVAEPLGPPDLAAWTYAVTGGLLGLVTALALFTAAHG